jgi:hypothetical protein
MPPPWRARASVTVAFAWEAPAPASWTTDRGYEVVVDHGELVTSLVELVPCEPPAPPAKKTALLDLVAGAQAHAGHLSSPELEVNRFRHLYLANLLSDAPVTVGTFAPPSGPYCSVFTLTSRWASGPLPSVDGAASDLTARRLTLAVTGRWRGAGAAGGAGGAAAEWHPFTAETTSADGRLWTPDGRVDATPAAATVELSASAPATLTIVRSRARLFDGIDFAHATSEQIARAVVANVGGRVSVQ